MRICVLAVGKLKERFWKDACAEYMKRLSHVDIIEAADERGSDNNISRALVRESERILSYVKPHDYLAALCVNGAAFSSVELASLIETNTSKGVSRMVFVIGGSHGLHKNVIDRAAIQVSFSQMTFPHQLMRVILLEQIYRAGKIIKKETYHK